MKYLSEKLARKDIFKRGLALPQLQNRGTRILTSRFGTRSNATSKTFHVTVALAQHFDQVRLIFANTSVNLGIGSYLAKVGVTSSLATDADINNSAGTWQAVTMEGNTALSIPISDETDIPEYAFSDPISIQSIPRTDGGTLPLLTIRMRAVSIATVACYGDGIDDFTSWVNHPSGRVWIAREQDGDFLTTTTGFNSTTNVSQSPIVGVQYLSRGKVVTAMACGDSITDGRGTVLGEGFIFPACVRLSNMSDVAVEYANLGWSGQTYGKFYKRGLNALLGELSPDMLFFPAGSPNDIGGSPNNILASHIANFASQRSALTDQCFEVGVKPVIWTMLPSNTAVKSYGATDALRVAYNAQVLELAQHDLTVIDTATAASGSTVGGQVQMAGTDDGIHPNTALNNTLSLLVEPAIKKFMGYPSRRNSAKSKAKQFPVYPIVGGSITMSRPGFYIFAGSSAATVSFTTIAPLIYKREPLVANCYNRSTANVTFSSTVQFSISGVSQSGFVLLPGASCTMVYDGTVVNVLFLRNQSSVQKFVPTTGQTIAVLNNRGERIISSIVPAGTLAALTVTAPPTPFDGQLWKLFTTQAITALTINGGTVVNPPSPGIAANGYAEFFYSSVDTTWYRCG